MNIKNITTIFILLYLQIPQLVASNSKIGLIIGSFDPPHLGHMSLVTRAKRDLGLDQVYVIPKSQSDIKYYNTPYIARLEMVRLAFRGFPFISLPDQTLKAAEIKQGANGVMHAVLDKHPGATLYRITGDDVIDRVVNSAMLDEPRFRDVRIVVGRRQPSLSEGFDADLKRLTDAGLKVDIVSSDAERGFSSSAVKASLSRSSFDVPVRRTVLDYIIKNHIYLPLWRCAKSI